MPPFGDGYESEKKQKRTIVHGVRQPPSSDSSRAINAQLENFFGTTESFMTTAETSSSKNHTKGKLGDPIDNYGKAAVMILANNGIQPKFSKYSGVCEWKNCVFLWVNIVKGKGVNYGNTFNEKGRFITWFGGSKMTEGELFLSIIFSYFKFIHTFLTLRHNASTHCSELSH